MPILILSLLPIFNLSAQDTALDERDSLHIEQIKLKEKHVDSMVSHIRKEFYKNNFDITIELGEETLKQANEINNLKAVVSLSSLIGNAFLKIDDTLQARRIFMQAVEKAEKEHDSTKISVTAQIDMGNFYALQENSKKAIPIYQKTLPLAEKLGDTTHLYILNYNIAELYLNDEDPDNAKPYVDATNKYVESLNPDAYHAGALLLTGKMYYLMDLKRLAIKSLLESVTLSEKSGFMDGLIEGHEFLANSYASIGDHELAFEQMQLLDSYKAEKYKSDKIEAIEYATAKYKLNEYQQELKEQALRNEINQQTAKRETTIFWVKIASAILLVFTIFLFISYRKRKQLLLHLIEKNKQYLQEKEKSEELAKAKTTLFSNITHELRTPMYGIIGITSLMIKDSTLRKHKENLGSLKFSANHLLSLINNVLQLTNIDNSKNKELKRAKVNIRNIVNNIVKSSKFINPEHPNKYKIDIDKTIPENLVGDEMKISQVLINLIGNSAKFTSNGVITIRIKRKEDVNGMVCLDFNIKDTGVGISKEKQEHIFNEFAQASSTKEYQGSGLGLPIVKKILDLYGSEISLVSEPGKGTEVGFELCYEPLPEKIKKTNSTKKYGKNVFSNKEILVVDDNKINLLVTSKFLSLHGAKVATAESGKLAIAMAKEKNFAAILMDINMPEINGFEATEAIREFDTKVPIIALTAVELEKVIGANSFNLMNDFIIKPYENDEFISTLLKHMKPSRRAKRQGKKSESIS
ncbi:MAG: response regulator [Flavobacterium sp.]|nr:MAG: response regulator [Flavobacterium sp.]